MKRSKAEKLLPQYFRGDLSSGEREELVRAVLEDQNLYNAFAGQQALTELLNDRDVSTRVLRALQPSRSQARGLIHVLGNLAPKWRFAIVFLLLVLVAAPFLIKRAAVTFTSVRIIALTLTPLERGSGSSEILRLPPGNHVVVLTALVNGQFSETYSAVVDGGGGEIEFNGLHSNSGPPGFQSVTIRVPSNRLTPGNYTVTLYASADGSRSNPVVGYVFTVVRVDR